MDSDEDCYYQDSDWDDRASDGSDTNEPDYSASSALRKPYRILTEEDIKHLLENDISEVSSVLSVPRGVACVLLCRNKWSQTAAYDRWFAAGEERNPNPNPNAAVDRAGQGSTNKICKICYEYPPPENMVSAACGHPFCSDCWKQYITTAVSDGAGCLTLNCPEPGCREAATSEIVEKLSSEAVINKYHKYLLRSYVESSRERKWCPAAGCDRAVELDGGESDSQEVTCYCSYRFCWRCAEERHRPLSCEMVADWAETTESKNTTWIVAYTKPCPKCRRPIEKNQGCNHMTCGAPCLFEFCWICAAPWEQHGYSDVACNRYTDEQRQVEGKDQEDEDEDAKNRKEAKRFIRRYSHYYERWDSNDKARKRAMEDLERARERYGGKVGLQFVVEAWEQIVECRHVLKCSYVYGFYLPEAEGAKKALFEYLQGQAEAELERLHHCVEKEIVDEGLSYVDSTEFTLFRAKLSNLTKVVSNYFQNLVVGLEDDLSEAF